MLFCRSLWLLLLVLPGHSVLAQSAEPDLYIPEFFPVIEDRAVSENRVPDARAWVHSDGRGVSLVVEVLDDQIVTFQSPAYSDHIQIWLGLDETAFPARFPLGTHPNYLGGMDITHARGGGSEIESIRMFTSDPVSMSGRDPFHRSGTDSMLVPDPSRIREISVPYGMMHLAFFPDERRVELLDRRSYRYLEQQFNRGIGDWLRGIRYDVDTLEHNQGYVVSVDIPASSFGFARMPKMDALKLLIGVADVESAGVPARIQSYSQPVHGGIGYGDIQNITFRNPIFLNPSNIPDEVFVALKWFPTLFLSTEGWTVVSADADAMLPSSGQTAPGWQEILFAETQIDYQDYRPDGFPVQRLSARFDQLHAGDLEKDFFLIDHQTLVVSRIARAKSNDQVSPFRVFALADGSTGIFTRESGTFHPYGWGDCGACLHERMSVFRYSDHGLSRVASWEQSEGPETGFRIDGQYFKDFFLGRMDLIKGNEIIVLVLYHQRDRIQKRIKLTWDSSSETYLTTIDP